VVEPAVARVAHARRIAPRARQLLRRGKERRAMRR
jgi:hypothetical protein